MLCKIYCFAQILSRISWPQNDLLSNRITFPINLLPESEWLTIIRNRKLEAKDLNKLIKLIPKNTTREIKQIKRFLQILRKPKLV